MQWRQRILKLNIDSWNQNTAKRRDIENKCKFTIYPSILITCHNGKSGEIAICQAENMFKRCQDLAASDTATHLKFNYTHTAGKEATSRTGYHKSI